MTNHQTSYRVRYADTDAAGVVYHANHLKYFEIGRSEFMRDHVCSYKEIEDTGIVLPVTEAFTRYKAPAFYDDLLIIETRIDELKCMTCKFAYKISRDDGGRKTKLIARGYTIHAAISKNGKLTQLPNDIITKLQNLCSKQ